ncbi:hypothetical protein GCM10022212_12140 [Actimicrobium antarcticum]|uniref:LysR family transcriptional regulator n=1 Tax=Actimicrobium antarcticum TaxID=1051899 RepID=A0ABP7SXH6_9BURK
MTGLAVLASALLSASAYAEGIKVDGYIREGVSINLQDPIETATNDQYKVSMARSTARINLEADTGPVVFSVKARASREIRTSYLKDLEAIRFGGPTVGGANAGDGNSLGKAYNEAELREWYADFSLGERIKARIGKQQVAWGETDFFAGNDLIHGFDYSWRSFLESANEELRKPLIMANINIAVPEAGGSLQVLVRPGLDRRKDIGNTYDLFGGRWANQPNKGLDFFANGFKYNLDNPEGNYKKTTGGVRWNGLSGGLNYSVSYLKTFNPDPVINPAFAPWKGAAIQGGLGDLIYPTVDVFGATISGYAPVVDAVFSTEMAYIKHYAFNYGYDNGYGFLSGSTSGTAGFSGITQKNVIRTTVRMDKNLAGVSQLLGAEKPAFFSVQVFDTWIQNYKSSEQIVNLVGFGQARKEHSTIVTGILGLSYNNGKIKPELVGGVDATYGGGFIVPSVSFEFGNNWRLKTEMDLFWNNGSRNPGNSATERDTALFGYFNKNSQLYTSLTYQF